MPSLDDLPVMQDHIYTKIAKKPKTAHRTLGVVIDSCRSTFLLIVSYVHVSASGFT